MSKLPLGEMNQARTTFRTIVGRLSSATRSQLHLAGAAPVFGLALAGVLPSRPGFVIAASLVIAGFGHLAAEFRERFACRRQADRLLAAIDTDRVPERLRWRAAELTRRRERRALARALRNLLRSLDLPPRFLPTPVNRSALRRNRRAVEALASRLAALDRPVRPRGILLVRQLLQGSVRSPLYDVEEAGELRAALARACSEIEPR